MQDALEKIDQRIGRYVASVPVSALAVGIFKDGDLVYEGGFGDPNITIDTSFPSCSTGKTITATAVMKMVEQGSLDLDRPVIEYVPELRFPEGGDVGGVTLRHLLSHTSGLSSDPEIPIRYSDDPENALRDQVLNDVPTYAAIPPGEALIYSNPGFSIAGHIASIVSGQPFPALVDDLVLSPLGMSRTSYDPKSALSNEVKDTLREEFRDSQLPAPYPAGGAVTTVRDLGRLAMCHLARGADLLATDTVGLMQTVHADAHCLDPRCYGLGFDIESHRGHRLVTHGGGGSGCGSSFVMVPDEDLAVVSLFNHPAGYGVRARDILDALFDWDEQPSSLINETFHEGEFEAVFDDVPGYPSSIVTGTGEDGRFVAFGHQRHELVAHADSVYVTADARASVGFVPGGRYAMLDLAGIGLVSTLPYRVTRRGRSPRQH
jgi:CubicO group peptidase (beta-lactamase class C family)